LLELDLLNGRSQCESAETSGSLLGERSLLKIAMDRNFTNLNKMAQQLICKRQVSFFPNLQIFPSRFFRLFAILEH